MLVYASMVGGNTAVTKGLSDYFLQLID